MMEFEYAMENGFTVEFKQDNAGDFFAYWNDGNCVEYITKEQFNQHAVEEVTEKATLKTLTEELFAQFKGSNYTDKRNHRVNVEKMIMKLQKFITIEDELTLVELSSKNSYGRETPNYNGIIKTKDKTLSLDSILAHTANRQFYRFTVKEIKN